MPPRLSVFCRIVVTVNRPAKKLAVNITQGRLATCPDPIGNRPYFIRK
jgi:hypothetical protein